MKQSSFAAFEPPEPVDRAARREGSWDAGCARVGGGVTQRGVQQAPAPEETDARARMCRPACTSPRRGDEDRAAASGRPASARPAHAAKTTRSDSAIRDRELSACGEHRHDARLWRRLEERLVPRPLPRSTRRFPDQRIALRQTPTASGATKRRVPRRDLSPSSPRDLTEPARPTATDFQGADAHAARLPFEATSGGGRSREGRRRTPRCTNDGSEHDDTTSSIFACGERAVMKAGHAAATGGAGPRGRTIDHHIHLNQGGAFLTHRPLSRWFLKAGSHG